MDAMILSTVHRRRILKGAAGTSFRAWMNTKHRVVKMILTEEASFFGRGPDERLENIQ
jgi:hypothetical protein